MTDPIKLKVPFYPGTYIDINTVIERLDVPRETVRRWCVNDGIGRKRHGWGNVSKWEVSLPALRMRQANDLEALIAYCGGDRSSELVAQYMVTEKEAVK